LNSEGKKVLFKDWIKHKKAEAREKKKRLEVEKKIEDLFQFEGKSKTFNEEGFKITLKKTYNYKLDQEKWKIAREDVPDGLRPENIKFSLIEAGYIWLEKNDKENFKKVAECVTIKPGKTGVEVKKEG
jgi:hypothetical protein